MSETKAESRRRLKNNSKTKQRPPKRKEAIWYLIQAMRPLESEFENGQVSWRCEFEVSTIGHPEQRNKIEVWCLIFTNGARGIYTCIDGWLSPVYDRDLKAIAARIIAKGYELCPDTYANYMAIPEIKGPFDLRNHGVILFSKENEPSKS